jgi:hypothetical protein
LLVHLFILHSHTFLVTAPAELHWQGPLLVDTALRMVTGPQESLVEAASSAATSLVLALEVSMCHYWQQPDKDGQSSEYHWFDGSF